MNIQYMRYFMTIAKLENVSKAAELLHLSQSSLSKNIAALEKELGTRVFDRKGKKLVLNEVGLRFLESCQVILDETDSVMRDLELMTTGHSNRIRISTAGVGGNLFDCMAGFLKDHPETEYEIDCSADSDDPPDINDYDMIIYPDDPKYARFKGYDFYDERYFLAVNCENELARRASAPTKYMDGERYVFLRHDSGRVEYPFKVCNALAIQMESCNFVSNRELHRQMISTGIAVGFVPEELAEMYRQNGVIRLLPLMDQRFTRAVKVCFKREKHLADLALLFKNYMIRYFSLEDAGEVTEEESDPEKDS